MADFFIDRTAAVLGKTLDGTAARQRTLADNIANVDTPGYVRQEVTFESQLRDAMSAADAAPASEVSTIEAVDLAASRDASTPARSNGNNVVIEKEMGDVARNMLQYETAAHLLSLRMRALRSAISEGRK
jgi:flagellar basal-body rod protein FlgB